jgi:hypothetical protein
MFFQVDIDLRGHNGDSLSRLRIENDDIGVERLTEWESVEELWPEQPADKYLSVFVKLPAIGEQSGFLFMHINSTDDIVIPFSPAISLIASSFSLRSANLTSHVHPLPIPLSRFLFATTLFHLLFFFPLSNGTL